MSTEPKTTENRQESDISPRSISPDGTVIEHGQDKSNGGIPEVDLEFAATLKPSRLRGKSLMFMVTFVAGTGVSQLYETKLMTSLPCLDMIKVS
jgi:hypothetical protein